MRQNIYDDPDFFAGYNRMRDEHVGLHDLVIVPALPRLLPPLARTRVLDVVEHPIMTARLPKSGWTTEGDRHVAWPVDHYFDEGSRAGSWFVDGVVRWPALLAVRAVKPR